MKKIIKKLKFILREKYYIFLLWKSKLFSLSYYKKETFSIKKKLYKHYLYEGYKEGLNPSKNFDTDYYLNKNADVKNADVNPLIHYLTIGKKEGRKIKKAEEIELQKVYKKIYNNDFFVPSIQLELNERRLNIIMNEFNEFMIEPLQKILKLFDSKIKIRIIYFKGKMDLKYKKKYNCMKINSKYDVCFNINDINICLDEFSTYVINNCPYLKNTYFYNDNIVLNENFSNYLMYNTYTKKIVMISEKRSLKKMKINDIKTKKLSSICFCFQTDNIVNYEIAMEISRCQNFQNTNFIYFSKKLNNKIHLSNDVTLNPLIKNADIKIIFSNNEIYIIDSGGQKRGYIEFLSDHKFESLSLEMFQKEVFKNV